MFGMFVNVFIMFVFFGFNAEFDIADMFIMLQLLLY